MFLSRFLVSRFCTAGQHKHHVKITQLVKRMTTAQETHTKQQQDITSLQSKLKQKQELNKKRNNQVHEMRVRLTNDIKKAEQIWTDAKKKIQTNKSSAVFNFAKGLTQLGDQLKKTSSLKKQQHSPDLRQGFQLTQRLFLTTLQKFNIKTTELKQNDQVKKGQFEKTGEEKTDNAQLKGKVAKVLSQGWSVQGKITTLPKVILYV